jgi:hypothetical protein
MVANDANIRLSLPKFNLMSELDQMVPKTEQLPAASCELNDEIHDNNQRRVVY